jgi:hypothetical protein
MLIEQNATQECLNISAEVSVAIPLLLVRHRSVPTGYRCAYQAWSDRKSLGQRN